MLQHILVISSSGLVLFQKQFQEGLTQPSLTGSLLTALLSLCRTSVQQPASFIGMSKVGLGIASDSERTGVTCAVFGNYLETVQQYVRLHASAGNTPRPKSLPLPTKLEWDLSPAIEESIRTAITNVAKFIQPYTLDVLEYSSYGLEEIRKLRVSPDAFVQMAIQLAYYKVHGKCVATYESAQTRAFFHGRTENVRTLSTLSVAFCKTFEDKNATAEDKIAALTRAIAGHVAYMNEASAGSGIDRHLLALRLLAGAAGEKPALFDDPAFSRSMHFQLSTSNLTPAPEFFGGFGPMYLDGYGVAYALRPYGFWFSVTAHTSCAQTSGTHLIAALRASLDELRLLMGRVSSQL